MVARCWERRLGRDLVTKRNRPCVGEARDYQHAKIPPFCLMLSTGVHKSTLEMPSCTITPQIISNLPLYPLSRASNQEPKYFTRLPHP